MVRFLINLVVVHGVSNLYEFRDWAFLQNIMASVLHLLARVLLNLVRVLFCRRWVTRHAFSFQSSVVCLIVHFVNVLPSSNWSFRWVSPLNSLNVIATNILLALVDINLHLNIVIVLSQWITHVAFKLCNREIQFELVVHIWQIGLKQGVCKTPNEAALVILHHFVEVAFEELKLEVSQVETAVVVSGELIRHI